jgi:vacuolar-type H+-ATPase subunit E/Vma4
MSEEHKKQALADEILSDARRQAERKLDRARKRAERLIRTARAKVEGIEQEAMGAASEKLDGEKALLMADVPHQDLVRTLRARDKALQSLFDKTLSTLAAREGLDVLAVLTSLSVDAVAQMSGDTFVLELAERDAESCGNELVTRVADEVKAADGRELQLTAAASDDIPEGGVIVRSDRELVDNSFAARAKRAERELRGQLADIIFGDTDA